MNYGTLETALVTRLNAYFTTNNVDDTFEAVAIPQNQAEQERPFTKSRVTIQYFTSAYQPNQGMGAVTQAETVTIRATFEARTLREANGFYNLVEHTKRCLLGYTPANCTKKLTIDKYDMVFYENNTISPYLDFKTEAMNVEVAEETELPAFVDLTIESQCPS